MVKATPKKSYNVLVVEDYDDLRSLLCDIIEMEGHTPVPFPDGSSAINYLKEENAGVPNHRNIAMILSDLDMPNGNGFHVLEARNELDATIPMYWVSGFAKPHHVAAADRVGLDGYIQKMNLVDDIRALTRYVLAEKVPVDKKIVVVKFGGSALDYLLKTVMERGVDVRSDPSLARIPQALLETLRSITALQTELNYQVVVNVGGGPNADITKAWRRLLGSQMDGYYDEQSPQDLMTNAKALKFLLGDNAVLITPGKMTGREPLDKSQYSDLSLDAPFVRQLDLKKLYDPGKIWIIPIAPRNLGMGYPEIVSKDDSNYPNIHPSNSDANTVLITHMVDGDSIVLGKRVDDIYERTPYEGYQEGNRTWWWTQRTNSVVGPISYKDVLKGRIARRGAFDSDGGHMMDDPGLKLAQKLGIERIYLWHIAPHEMYVNTGAGIRHVVTTSLIPDQAERVTRGLRLWDCVLGTAESGYMYSN